MARSIHFRNRMRKYRQRISILLAVLGALCLVIAAFFGLTSLFQYEYQQARFRESALYFLAGGAGLLLIRLFFFQLPEWIKERRSETAQRRREHFRSFKSPRPYRAPNPTNRSQDGSIMILTLVLLGAVTTLALHTIITARAAHAEAHHAWQASQLTSAALDSAHAALQLLADDADLDMDYLAEEWAQYREVVDPAGITRMTRIVDAHRAFDLNNLAVAATGDALSPAPMLANILVQCGLFTPGQRVDALRDWVDADEAGLFEDGHYRRLDPPSRTADRVLYGAAELFLVEGWTADLFARKSRTGRRSAFDADLADSVTLLPIARERIIPMNINTVDQGVLISLVGPGNEGIAADLMARRRNRPFRDTSFLSSLIGEDAYRLIAPYLDVKSSYFHIQTASYAGGKTSRLNLLARRDEKGGVQAISAFF